MKYGKVSFQKKCSCGSKRERILELPISPYRHSQSILHENKELNVLRWFNVKTFDYSLST